jgi:hypothetical protein
MNLVRHLPAWIARAALLLTLGSAITAARAQEDLNADYAGRLVASAPNTSGQNSGVTPQPTTGAQQQQNAAALQQTGAQDASGDQQNDNSTNSTTSPAAQPDESFPQGPASSSQYFPPYSEPNQGGYEGIMQSHALPANSFEGDQQSGIPYSSVLTKDGADLNDIDTLIGSPLRTGVEAPTKLGNIEGNSAVQSGNFTLGIPFFHAGTEPADADIKAGPFYIKFHSADGLALYDDNFRRRETRRQSETLVLLRLNLSVIAQLAENLEFAISGSIMYLPIQNQVGVEAPAFSALGLLLYGAPLFTTQLVYDTMVAGWPVRFADDFRVNTGSYSDSTRDTFDLFQGDYLTQNPQGGYYFRSTRVNGAGEPENSSPENFDADVVYLSNEISALTDRLLPGDVRLTVRLDHENLYYNQDNRGLPPGRDDFYTALVSERENLRFKPYTSYELTYVEGTPFVTQQAHIGIYGPIDDQVFLRADAGIYINANGQTGELYKLSLDHIAGPYTQEHITAERALSEFDDSVTTSEYYLLQQTLGPTLNANFFVDYFNTQDLVNGSGASFKGELAGAQLQWQLGPKTNLNIAGVAERQDYEHGPRTDTLTGRVTLDRVLSDSLTCQLLYQYQRASSNHSNDSYYENLMYFRIVKFFD